MSNEFFKYEYKDILNALVEMQEAPVYATRRSALLQAEQAITALERKVSHLEGEVARVCVWVPMDELNSPGSYEGTCGVAWTFIEGGLEDNETGYCPRCGGKIIQETSVETAKTEW